MIPLLLVTFSLFSYQPRARAFALLGPAEPWQVTNGWVLATDIGGAMALGEEYRWNIPVLTYGFDDFFLNYFGSNGVAAVTAAIAMLNDLPPASEMILTNFSQDIFRRNYLASYEGVRDLKYTALSVLLEEMGLAGPREHVFDLRKILPGLDPLFNREQWWPDFFIDDGWILQRNYDPVTTEISHFVNGSLFTGQIVTYVFSTNNVLGRVEEFQVFPDDLRETAVADAMTLDERNGCFVTGLSRDDAGGLRYLLHPTNINFETFPATVRLREGEAGAFINGAYRGGVDKIAFVPHPVGERPGSFLPFTNHFADRYMADDQSRTQQLTRITGEPDIVFGTFDKPPKFFPGFRYSRTDASRWSNHAAMNGNPGGAGPGTISSPIRIVFNENNVAPWGDFSRRMAWGYFDGSTNPVVTFPVATASNYNYFRLRLGISRLTNNVIFPLLTHEWRVPLAAGETAVFQTSTNLEQWSTMTSFTNQGTAAELEHWLNAEERYFRVIKE